MAILDCTTTLAQPNASDATDISLAVIHKRAKRPYAAKRSELVNNCAADQNKVGERPALARSRSRTPNPKRVTERLPAEPEALAPTSNRKRPQEGHYIRAVDSRAKRRRTQSQAKTMNEFKDWQLSSGIWRCGLGQRKTLRHRCRPKRQSHRRLSDRALGFRLEKVSPKAPTLRWDSFCH